MTAPVPAIPPLVEGDRVRFADTDDEWRNKAIGDLRGIVRAIGSGQVTVHWCNRSIMGNWRCSGPAAWFVRATD
jgi:hypothetical protein